MKEFWNERYSGTEYVYGKQANAFFINGLKSLKSGKLLLPAEGEGRNAVYAAQNGWSVTAFDQSEQAKKKALRLAKENKVDIRYEVNTMDTFTTDEKYDAVALIYAHFHDDVRMAYHQKLLSMLRSDGVILLEAFHQRQLKLSSGGPKRIDMLYTREKLMHDFNGSIFVEIFDEGRIEINEGPYHRGEAEIIRLLGHKII